MERRVRGGDWRRRCSRSSWWRRWWSRSGRGGGAGEAADMDKELEVKGTIRRLEGAAVTDGASDGDIAVSLGGGRVRVATELGVG